MEPALYIAIFLPLWVLILTQNPRKKKIAATFIKKRKHNKEMNKMQEIAKRFIGKECIVYLFDGNSVTGTVEDVCEGAILVKRANCSVEIINLDYALRIREFPCKKNGKKKSVVLD